MKDKSGRSIFLSQLGVGIFAALLLALDLGGRWAVGWFANLRGMDRSQSLGVLLTLYVGSVFAWALLWQLWRLLGNLRREQVFIDENVRLLGRVSLCCALGAGTALVGSWVYLPFLFVALAAAFMALIVRIVKNIFQQAIAMKSELDLTV